MKRLISFLAIAASAWAQYTPTPRTLTDAEVGLILQTPVTNGGQTYAATGQYAIGFVVANPNGISPITGASSLPLTSILGMHGVGQQWALGNEHVGGYDLPTELAAYEAAEVAAGRGRLFVTSGGNPVYYDNSGFPYGKRPINVCDPRFVRFMANEQMRRRMLSPSNPGGAQSPQYPMLWQSWDEGFYLYSVYGFPGGTGDGSTWDAPFPQNQGQYTACIASYYAQLYAIAPDVFITLNQGSLAEANGTVNNNDLTLFQQIYNSSPNLNIDTENFLSPGTSTTETQTFFNRVQNITGWLSTTGRTAMYRGVIDGTAGQMQSNALAYLIAKEGNSFFSEGQNSLEIDPNNATYPWASIFDEMGTPTSAYSTIACTAGGSDYSNKVLERQYEGGIVYYNNCTSTQTITLPGGTWYDSTGTPQTSLTILSYASGVDSAVAQYVTNANYTVTPIVQPPQITPLGNGTITGSVTATITDGTSGATICYTTDGSMPTASAGTCIHGSTYSTALTISITTTLTAIASHTGDANSWERATTFTITGTNPNVQTVVLNDATTPFFPLTYVALVLSNPSAAALTVNYTVTCDANITCSPSSGTATFAAFQTAIAVPVTVTLGSTTAADTMLFTVTSGTGYTVGAQSTYTLTVKRDFLPAVTNQYTEIHASSWGQGRSDLPTDNQNTGTTITAGVIPTTPATFRTAWKFDLSSVPSTATVTKATMLGYSPTNTDTGYAITAATCAAGVGTVTIGSNPLAIGQTVLVTGSTSTGTGYNSTAGVVITATPSNQISYAIPSCTNTTWVSGGTVFTMLYPTSVYRATTGFTQSTVDWNNYFINGTVCSGGPCWAASPSATNYQTPGNSINGNTTGVLTITNSANHYDLTTDTQNIVNSTNPNNGWVMTSSESAAHRETFAWYTSAAANPPPESPSLLVQYNTPASCTVSAITPTANQTISGNAGGSGGTIGASAPPVEFLFTAAVGNCPQAKSVEFTIDNPDDEKCISTNAPNFPCKWNSFNTYNGTQHTVYVTAKDVYGNVLAQSTVSPITINNWQPETVSQLNVTFAANQTLTAPVSGSITFTPTVTGSLTGTANISYYVRVDGQFAGGTFGNLTFNTAQFNNGTHAITITALDNGNCLGAVSDCPHATVTGYTNGKFNEFGNYEVLVDFENGAANMEARTEAFEMFLCPGGATLCPATHQIVPYLANTDESTSTCTSPTYSSGNTGVATVSGGGLVTAVAQGSTQITVSCNSGSFTRKPWVFVNSQNVLPHFGMPSSGNANILTAYDPTQSVFVNSMFQSCAPGTGDGGFFETYNYPPAYSFGTDYIGNGFNTCEPPYGSTPSAGGACGGSSCANEAAFQAATNATIGTITSQTAGFNMMFLPIGDTLTRTDKSFFQSIHGLGSAYVTPPVQFDAGSWAGLRAVASSMGDEINATWGDLSGGNGAIGSNGFTNIDCTTNFGLTPPANTCLINATNLSQYINAAFRFVITGSGDANLDYNTASGNAPTYLATKITANQFSFPRPAGIGATTYTSGSNPSLIFHYWAVNTWSGAADPVACPPEGASTGPCPQWILSGDFTTFNNQIHAASTHPPAGYSNAAATSATAQTNWGALSDFASIYFASSANTFLGRFEAVSDLQGIEGNQQRIWYSSLNPAHPVTLLSAGDNVSWNLDGYTLAVASISDNIVTFSQDHKIRNVIEGDTRMLISGTSLSADNAQMYVIASPTSTTASIVFRKGQFTESDNPNNTNGTAHFQDGRTLTVFSLGNTLNGVGPGGPFMTLNADTGCTMNTHLGQTVTFTGSAVGTFGSPNIWYVPFSNAGICVGAGGTFPLYQLPLGSSTGGNSDIQLDNNYTRGVAVPLGGAEAGPRSAFASAAYPMILRAAGKRSYIMAQNWSGSGATQALYKTTYASKDVIGVQGGAHPLWNNGGAGTVLAWNATSGPALFSIAKAKYILQPSLVSPDYGRFIECVSRQGSYGNILMCQSFSDGSLTRAISLSPYLQAGQAILRYAMTWQGLTVTSITAGTTSDTVTIPPAGFVAYIFSTNAAAEYAPPTFSARLADVTGAASIAVQYGYTSQPFTNSALQKLMQPQAVNCGTGSCTIPVDRSIAAAGGGNIFKRILYLNSAGTVISVGDVQSP